MKCVKFVHFFVKAFPQSFQDHVFLLMLMMMRRKVDRQTPLASAPPVILILIASDPSLVHTLTRIFIWPTSARNILIWHCISPVQRLTQLLRRATNKTKLLKFSPNATCIFSVYLPKVCVESGIVFHIG